MQVLRLNLVSLKLIRVLTLFSVGSVSREKNITLQISVIKIMLDKTDCCEDATGTVISMRFCKHCWQNII